MRNSLVRLCLLTVLFVALPAVLPAANESSPIKRVARHPLYDATKEVTLEGTVEGLVTKPAPGKMMGGHLMVATEKGPVDGQIGAFVLRGAHAFTDAGRGLMTKKELPFFVTARNSKQIVANWLPADFFGFSRRHSITP